MIKILLFIFVISILGVGLQESFAQSLPNLVEVIPNDTLEATDTAGNNSTAASNTLSVNIDRTAPTFTAVANSFTQTTVTFSEPVDGSLTLSQWTFDRQTPTAATANISGVNGGGTLADDTIIIFTHPFIIDETPRVIYTAGDIADNAISPNSMVDATVLATDGASVVPTTLTLTDRTDSGVSNSDDITSDNTPRLEVRAGTNDILIVTSDRQNGIVGNGRGAGIYIQALPEEIQLSTLVDGTHILTVTATDTAGNPPASNSLSITIDTSAPSAPAITLNGITDPTSTDPVLFTVDFGQVINPTTFAVGDVTASSGTVQNIANTGDNQNFTFEVSSPTDNTALTVSIPTGAVADTAGNTSTAASNILSVNITRTASEGDKYIFFAKGTIEIPLGTTMANGTIAVTETQAPAQFHLIVKENADGLYDVIRGQLKVTVYLDTQTEPIEKQVFFSANQATFSITNDTLAFEGTSTVNKVAKAQRTLDLNGDYLDTNSNGRQNYSILGDIEVSDISRSVNMEGTFVLQETAIEHRLSLDS